MVKKHIKLDEELYKSNEIDGVIVYSPKNEEGMTEKYLRKFVKQGVEDIAEKVEGYDEAERILKFAKACSIDTPKFAFGGSEEFQEKSNEYLLKYEKTLRKKSKNRDLLYKLGLSGAVGGAAGFLYGWHDLLSSSISEPHHEAGKILVLSASVLIGSAISSLYFGKKCDEGYMLLDAIKSFE